MDSMGSNPFMSGANPFGGMTPNPFGNLGGTSEAKQNNNFNIDDIVKKIIDGEMDEYPEAAFFNAGTIDDVIEKAKEMENEG